MRVVDLISIERRVSAAPSFLYYNPPSNLRAMIVNAIATNFEPENLILCISQKGNAIMRNRIIARSDFSPIRRSEQLSLLKGQIINGGKDLQTYIIPPDTDTVTLQLLAMAAGQPWLSRPGFLRPEVIRPRGLVSISIALVELT